MFRNTKYSVFFLIILSSMFLIGCGGALQQNNGSLSGSSATGAIVRISTVNLSPSTVTAGAASTGSIALTAAAPAGGAQVKLTSSNASVASVPSSVTVPAGQTSAGFAVATGNVSSDTSVVITASYNNTMAGNTVSVKAPVTPPSTSISISISPSSTSLLAGASQQFTAMVTGSANAAVSWTTTGGNIISTGLFTAPNVTASTIVSVFATSQADASVVKTAQVTVTPVPAPPPSGGGPYSGTGPVASWKAYLYLDTDNLYHQAIEIDNSQGLYPVIGYAYVDASCTNVGDTFNDFWQPIGNGLWWFIHDANLVNVRWVWYNSATNPQALQQTQCIDYSGAPKYN